MKDDHTPDLVQGKALPKVTKSNRKKPAVKTPAKSGPGFPLWQHKASGLWCKKVKGQFIYFEKVADDPDGKQSLEDWERDKEDYLAGREPRLKIEGYTVEQLCEDFIAHHDERQKDREISPRTYQGLFATCKLILSVFGKSRAVADLNSNDFRRLRLKIADTRKAANSRRNEMQRCRCVFKFAYDEEKIESPVKYGKGFEKPKRDVVRREREEHRNKHGDRMFEADEIRRMISTAKNDGKLLGASQPLRTMILLAANCGFGQTDLANLPIRAIDLEKGWVDFARVKTSVPRKIPLWPESVDAIREWMKVRPKAKSPADAGLLFLTVRGQKWVKLNATGTPADKIGQEFAKLVTRLKMKRPGVSFYALRHGFETIASETTDQIAVDAIMGHVTPGMSGNYLERIGKDRLQRIVDHVRAWLFASNDTDDKKPDDSNSESAHNDIPEADEPRLKVHDETCDPCDPSDRIDPQSAPAEVASVDNSRPAFRIVG